MILDKYSKNNGDVPYNKWVSRQVQDRRAIRTLDRELNKIKLGNFGNCKRIKSSDDLYEITVDYGPGYRIYYASVTKDKLVILSVGLKASQDRDIAKAQEYFNDYKSRMEK